MCRTHEGSALCGTVLLAVLLLLGARPARSAAASSCRPSGDAYSCAVPTKLRATVAGSTDPPDAECKATLADARFANALFQALTNGGANPKGMPDTCVQCKADVPLSQWINQLQSNGRPVCSCPLADGVKSAASGICSCDFRRIGLTGTLNLTILDRLLGSDAFPCDLDFSQGNAFSKLVSTRQSVPRLRRLLLGNNAIVKFPKDPKTKAVSLPDGLRWLDMSYNPLDELMPAFNDLPPTLEYLNVAGTPTLGGDLYVRGQFVGVPSLRILLITGGNAIFPTPSEEGDLDLLCKLLGNPYFAALEYLDLSNNVWLFSDIAIRGSGCLPRSLKVFKYGAIPKDTRMPHFAFDPVGLPSLECVEVGLVPLRVAVGGIVANLSRQTNGALRVVRISGVQLSGLLPPLNSSVIPKSLRLLDLSSNFIEGTLSLADFAAPFSLDVTHNSLVQLSVPVNSRIENLTALAAAQNMVSTGLCLYELSLVEWLDLSSNQMASPVSFVVSMISDASWRCLALNANRLSGKIVISSIPRNLENAYFEENVFQEYDVEAKAAVDRPVLKSISLDTSLCLTRTWWPPFLYCQGVTPQPTSPPPSQDTPFLSSSLGLALVCGVGLAVVAAVCLLVWVKVRRRRTVSVFSEEASQDVVIEGQYKVAERVGGGAFGTVYKVHRISDGHVFALKEVNFEREDTWNEALHEFNIMKKAQEDRAVPHPHIVQLEVMYVSWRNDDESDGSSARLLERNGQPRPNCRRVMCLVMEFFRDGTLKDRIQRGPMTESEIMDILVQLFEALVYLHNLNPPIIHRDIKPENMLMEGSRVALTDFGLSSARLDCATAAGTPNYQAPEIGQHNRYSPKVDVFSAGCVAYSMLTRRCGSNMRRMHVECRRPNFHELLWNDIAEVYPKTSSHLFDFVYAALRINPSDRPTAEGAIEMLQKSAVDEHLSPPHRSGSSPVIQ